MATFLVTPSMNPALRARVERAVSHRTRARHHAAALGLKGTFAQSGRPGLARLWPVAVAALIGLFCAAMVAHDRRVVREERRALLSAIAERHAALPAGHEGFLAATDRWITEAANEPDPTDLVDPPLRAPGALDAWLRRPAVYVHGLAAELGNPLKIGEATQGSGKDPFLLCLLSPPASSSERDLLAKVRGVYFGGAKVDEETANVRRLAEARLGLATMSPAFETVARAAEELSTLKRMRRELESAPLDQAKKATGAEVLIVVADEPKREARVTLVDLAAKKVVLRVRRRLEEQGKSPMAALHHEQLEGCAAALAVRRSVVE
ncbi:Hypothetical protein A7982_06149 [Minicystis rosea]|nr:Hypothetical protein A7982_06149 [Minicystis rosea]